MFFLALLIWSTGMERFQAGYGYSYISAVFFTQLAFCSRNRKTTKYHVLQNCTGAMKNIFKRLQWFTLLKADICF